MVQLNWTKISRDDLKSIYDYIARDSRKYAKLQVVKIKSRTNILKNNPEAGSFVPEFLDKKYRELIEGNYRIVYKVLNEHEIDILTVHHSARDLSKRKIY